MLWKKIILISFNLVLACYLAMAMMAFNKPDTTALCRDVSITIEEDVIEGFLTTDDVRRMLLADRISPVGKAMETINLREMEEALESKELIEQAECWKTQDNVVRVSIRQRIPVIRVMNSKGEDYYVDSHGMAMPHTEYYCKLVVCTGNISKRYAEKVLAPLANIINNDMFWKSQVVQLNILDDGSVEMVPRVGQHIIYLGQPTGITKKLQRLRKFYTYGLNKAGWNKYRRISLEFDNQIICKRNTDK